MVIYPNLFDLDFDALTPLEKIESLKMKVHPEIFELADETLTALHVISKYFRKRFNFQSIYVLDDNTIQKILEIKSNYKEDVILKSIILLDQCNLIYRFTCAKKFGIANERVKQLRINSWGEERIKFISQSKRFKVSRKIYMSYLEQEVSKKNSIYYTLIEALSFPVTETSCLVINECNNQLRIRFVS